MKSTATMNTRSSNLLTVEDLTRQLRELDEMLRDHCRDCFPEATYATPQDFVLAHGMEYTPQPLPKGFRRGVPKGCFDNAYRLARRHGLVYVEGFAYSHHSHAFPIHHAWCVEPNSRLVIDNTWEKPGAVYFGVPFNLAYRKSQKGSVLDNWEDGYPIFQHSTDETEWRYRPDMPTKMDQAGSPSQSDWQPEHHR